MDNTYLANEYMVGNTIIRIHKKPMTDEEINRRDTRIAEVAWEIIHQARLEGKDV